MQKITPCLWFDSWAEQAAMWYVSIVKNSILGPVPAMDKPARKSRGRLKGSVRKLMGGTAVKTGSA